VKIRFYRPHHVKAINRIMVGKTFKFISKDGWNIPYHVKVHKVKRNWLRTKLVIYYSFEEKPSEMEHTEAFWEYLLMEACGWASSPVNAVKGVLYIKMLRYFGSYTPITKLKFKLVSSDYVI
jgi:hypothetical protein